MVIVSMATESYVNWLHHFLTSLEIISDEKKIIFLINVEKSTLKKLKKTFPKVKFISEKKQLVPLENSSKKAFKVTYFKGEFIEKAFIRYGEPILWIDCTALIRKSPAVLLNKLENADALLMRRNFNQEFGKAVYAAEIFGLNDWETIQQYRKNCEKRKTEWFADQLALCEINTAKRDYIEFGKWSNFYYDQKANSWSDRGKTGTGILSADDYDFTQKTFINELEKTYPGYRKKLKSFFSGKESKPKILVHIDDSDWCYYTTVQEVTERLKDKYDFLIIQDAKKDFPKYQFWQGDMVWARCSSKRHQKLLSLRPDLRKISFSSVTTGGELAEDRIASQLQTSKGEAGIICQNKDVEFRLKYKLDKLGRTQDVFILYNGVDTNRFKPGKNKNQKPIIGFAGRTRTYQEDFIKGYSHILKPVCEQLDLEIMKATNEPGQKRIHKDMAEFYQKIDLLVLLGNCEGHSNTLNEAMASGIPIIAYPTGWHYENAQDQGIIWCNRNTIELYGILSDFKDNLEHYKALGQKNRDFAVCELSWSSVSQYYDTLFQKMILAAMGNISTNSDKPVDSKLMGIVKIKYISKDNGMNSQYGIFKPGKTYHVNIEAYNYFKQNFPNKFEFQDE